jgi:hypothetical protein
MVIVDTCIGISTTQMKAINIVKIERDGYKQISDSLIIEVKLYKEQAIIGQDLLKTNNSIMMLKDSLIWKEQKINIILTDDNKRLNKQIKKERTIKTVIYAIGGAIIASLTGTIIYLSGK